MLLIELTYQQSDPAVAQVQVHRGEAGEGCGSGHKDPRKHGGRARDQRGLRCRTLNLNGNQCNATQQGKDHARDNRLPPP